MGFLDRAQTSANEALIFPLGLLSRSVFRCNLVVAAHIHTRLHPLLLLWTKMSVLSFDYVFHILLLTQLRNASR